jgi:hypothetical protein
MRLRSVTTTGAGVTIHSGAEGTCAMIWTIATAAAENRIITAATAESTAKSIAGLLTAGCWGTATR